MASLLRSEFSATVESFTVVDCRFPYEFAGGHIPVQYNCTVRDMLTSLSRFLHFAFSALTLSVGRQEGHPAGKKTDWWVAVVVICLRCRFAYGPADAIVCSCFLHIQDVDRMAR